ncbi:Hypothetical protein FKW44_004390 [Caligus rogercresseyi]|uniref:Uncharacterized protein n=1 Tax=Caligus rogercresseyi TaxID=217165 RepID=A0A7T8HLR3_CALRO|nr:Hypothetical protein FKW44_004390 [Caligus rogercresseyi]
MVATETAVSFRLSDIAEAEMSNKVDKEQDNNARYKYLPPEKHLSATEIKR